MKRRVNLYNPNKPRQKFQPLSLSGSTTIATVCVLFVFICGLGLHYYAESQQQQFDQMKTKKTRIDAQVQAQQDRFASAKVSSELVAEQSRLKNEIASRKRLKNLLHKVQPSQRTNFSSYIYALAQASQSDSWLTEFVIDSDAMQLSLMGGATTGPSVPVLFEAIGKTEAFQGISFGSLQVESEESLISFEAEAELRAYE